MPLIDFHHTLLQLSHRLESVELVFLESCIQFGHSILFTAPELPLAPLAGLLNLRLFIFDAVHLPMERLQFMTKLVHHGLLENKFLQQDRSLSIATANPGTNLLANPFRELFSKQL